MSTLFAFINFVVLIFCMLELRHLRGNVRDLVNRVIKLENKKLDNSIETGYNKEDSIDKMIKLKLVYNSDTSEWDKLKELEK